MESVEEGSYERNEDSDVAVAVAVSGTGTGSPFAWAALTYKLQVPVLVP